MSMKKYNAAKFYGLAIILYIICLSLDQLSKYMAVNILRNNNKTISLFGDCFELLYLENQGAAWGIFNGKQIFLIAVTAIVMLLLIVIYCKIPKTTKYLLLRICIILIHVGAVGNLIDRVLHKYVIDFLYFKLIDFPVFNVADIYVTVGTFLLIISLIFVYDEEDFSFLKKGEK